MHSDLYSVRSLRAILLEVEDLYHLARKTILWMILVDLLSKQTGHNYGSRMSQSSPPISTVLASISVSVRLKRSTSPFHKLGSATGMSVLDHDLRGVLLDSWPRTPLRNVYDQCCLVLGRKIFRPLGQIVNKHNSIMVPLVWFHKLNYIHPHSVNVELIATREWLSGILNKPWNLALTPPVPCPKAHCLAWAVSWSGHPIKTDCN